MTGQARLIAYVVSTASAALAVYAWAFPRVEWQAAAVGIASVLIAELFASHFRTDTTVSLSNIVIFVALLVHGLPLAIIATLGAFPVFLVKSPNKRTIRTTFNTAQFALAAACGALVFEVITGSFTAAFPDYTSLLAVFVGALAYSTVNHALVAGIIALTTTDGFLATFRTVGPSLVMQVPYVGIAVLAAVVLERASVWALALMAVPALIARFGLLAFQRLDESYEHLVRGFVTAIEVKDLYTRGHSERVSELSVHVAEELGISYDERRLTRYAALLHDVGKIGVPLCVINKPGPLDDDEFAEIKKHPTIGAEILRDIDFLSPAIDIVRYHHERLDGRGYPHGVDESELSDIVRIVTAVDAFDAMTSTRSYRRALTVDDAVAELRRCTGRQFDSRMVEALARVAERIGWEPTIGFASEAQLHGVAIPVGTAQERFVPSDRVAEA